jgi:tetratricopeptide (TPR) repeat protein
MLYAIFRLLCWGLLSIFCLTISLTIIGCKDSKTDHKAEKLALQAVDSAIAANKIIQKNEKILHKEHKGDKDKGKNKIKEETSTHDSHIIPVHDDSLSGVENFITRIDKEKAKQKFLQAQKQEEKENYLQAITLYQETVRLDNTFAMAFFRLGLVCGAVDKHQEAITAYQKAILTHYQPLAVCYSNLAYQFLAVKKYQLAKTNFQKALSQKENAENGEAETYAGLAIACYYLNQAEEAQNAYLKAAKFDTNFLAEDIKTAISLKYLFTTTDMEALKAISEKIKNTK